MHSGQEAIEIRQEVTHTKLRLRHLNLTLGHWNQQTWRQKDTEIRQTASGDAED